MAGLSLVNVTKTYKNGFKAVNDFTLEIQNKEFIIFVGPSGCGKSTTLRMIAGLEDISSGELWIGDKLVNFLEPGERDLSMVFQNYALYPHMTVYQNMAFGLEVNKVPKEEIKERVMEAARILEIDHLMDRKPSALSGGQKQRVAIGSVIVRKPKVFLMDEPLSNLDAKLRTQMRVELSRLHQKLDSTIIYVTHDQVEAMTLGTRIVVMKDGIIKQVATPEDIYRNPIDKFVAGFIGSPSMNFLEVCVERKGRKACLNFAGQEIKVQDSCANKLIDGGYLGKKVVMGIRPEDLKPEGADGTGFEFTIELKEMLGAEMYVHGTADGEPVCARMKADCPVQEGQKLSLFVDPAQMKLFDCETEKNILYV